MKWILSSLLKTFILYFAFDMLLVMRCWLTGLPVYSFPHLWKVLCVIMLTISSSYTMSFAEGEVVYCAWKKNLVEMCDL